MSWIVGIPAWGEHHVATALRFCIPSVLAAARQSSERFGFVLHTDTPEAFADAFAGYPVEVCSVPSGSAAAGLCVFHGATLAKAKPGEFVALLNADHLVSGELFTACERYFARGRQLVLAATLRTSDGNLPVAGSPARSVIDYAIDHLHPITADCIWGSGKFGAPTMVILRNGRDVAVHGFHLHPVGLVAKPGIEDRVSVDFGLVNSFAEDEIQIVDREAAVIEVSPENKRMAMAAAPQQDDLRAKVADYARAWFSEAHRRSFSHRITLRGAKDAVFDDDPIVDILALITERSGVPAGLSLAHCPEMFVTDDLAAARALCLPRTDEPVDLWTSETEWLVRHITLPAGLILDVGTGTGRLAAPLVRAGRTVLGIDTSPTMRRFAEMEVGDPGCFAAISPAMLQGLVLAGTRASGAVAIWTLQHVPYDELRLTVELLADVLADKAPLWTLDMPDRRIPVQVTYGYSSRGWWDDGKAVAGVLSERFALMSEEAVPNRHAMLRRWER